ncbi:MAG: HAD-IIIA family hydrolase [Bacteroidetes bacterium]|nr:MAG: HAD-IIIA family hydrolase [Bacteroidota bacterium]
MGNTLKHAVILAGGKGTRLSEIRQDVPKPMMPVDGKPLLQYQLEMCAAQGIERVTLLVNHLKDSIIEHFGTSFQGVTIDYYEEESPMGTVGGVKAIEDRIEEDFLVLYGDVMMEMDLHRLYQFHLDKNSEATLVVHPNDHPYDSDLVELNPNDEVTAFLSKPHADGLRYHNCVNAAAYVFSPSVLSRLESGVKADFGKDIFPSWVGEVRMYGYSTTEYLKDMGTPDRLARVEGDVKSGKVARRSLTHPQKCIFLDRDGVLNYDTDLIDKPEDLELYPWTAPSLQKINRSDYLSVVTTNQSVVARGMTDEAGLAEIHKKMETELGEQHAFVDAIYYCPHHPHGGYEGERPEYKIDCDCRKPKPGMIMKAAKRFNIDLRQSWMIGDSSRDIESGKAAGVRTIALRTGHGGISLNARPDFHFDNLEDAVHFILTNPFEEHFARIRKLIAHTRKTPLVIGVGGQSRSGKTSFVSDMMYRLAQSGIQSIRLPLDQWIRPKSDRTPEENVYHNFRVDKMKEDIKVFLSGASIQIPGYADHPQRMAFSIHAKWSGEPIVFVEGVPALVDEEMASIYDYKVFVEVDEEKRRTRFNRLYEWKGKTASEIEDLYALRMRGEYEIIKQGRTFADDTVLT